MGKAKRVTDFVGYGRCNTDFGCVENKARCVGCANRFIVPVEAIDICKTASTAGCKVVDGCNYSHAPSVIRTARVYQRRDAGILSRHIHIERCEVSRNTLPDSLKAPQLCVRKRCHHFRRDRTPVN